MFLKEYSSKQIELSLEEKSIIENELNEYISLEHSIKFETFYLCTLKAKFYIGLLKVSETLDIIIQPKIETADFLAMLAYIEPKYIILFNELLNQIDFNQTFFDYFIKIFLSKTEALLIQNRRKGYTYHESIEKIPKGKINISKSLRLQGKVINEFVTEKFYHTMDTPYNQVIKFTLESIRELIPKNSIPIFRRLMYYLKKTNYRPWMPSEIERLSYDRLTYSYKDIHALCIMILQDFSINFKPGNKKFFTFVLNSWNVFENFIRKIFSEYQQKYIVNAYRISCLSFNFDWDSKKGRPDIILQSKNGKKIVIDVKYKDNFIKADENQLYRYMGENDAMRGYLIYPKSRKLQEGREEYVPILNEKRIIAVKVIDLSKIRDRSYLRNFVVETVN